MDEKETLKVVLRKVGLGNDSWTWELQELDGHLVASGNYMSSREQVKGDYYRFRRKFINTGIIPFEDMK